MMFTRTHRNGALASLMFATAAVLPAQVQGETAAAQVTNSVPVVSEAVPAAVPPLVEAPVAAVEEPKKTIADSTIIGEGVASYYGAELAGNRTASGERFNPDALTAAHRTLPMGTKVKVTNVANGKSVIVRINDRGPFAKKRIIDVSRAAAERISMVRSGTARVTIERVS